MSKARIMIVEDEEYLIELIKASLEELGYSVVAHSNSAKKSIPIANELRPDLILMDIKLEGPMDGIQAAEIIQNQLDIPIVFLTAHDEDDKLERAKLAMPFGYLLKPFRTRELKVAIELAVYRHAAESAKYAKVKSLFKMHNDFLLSVNTILDSCQRLIADKSLKESQLKTIDIIRQRSEQLLLMVNEIEENRL